MLVKTKQNKTKLGKKKPLTLGFFFFVLFCFLLLFFYFPVMANKQFILGLTQEWKG